MRLTYVGPIAGPVDIPALRLTVEAGKVFELPDEDAALLLEQPSNFEQATRSPSKTKNEEK